MNWPLVIIGLIACAVLGYFVKQYHAKWQEKKDEEQLIAGTVEFLNRMQQFDNERPAPDLSFDRKAADKARWRDVEETKLPLPSVD